MSQTRQQIVESAFLLFLKKGFKAVRLSDIEHAAGITRGTFYYYFETKESVLKEGLDAYYDLLNASRIDEYSRIKTLKDYIVLSIEKLEGIDDYTAKEFSCEIPEVLCLSLMIEALSLYPELREKLFTYKLLRLSKVEELIAQAQMTGEIRKDLEISVLAKNLLNIGAGVFNYLLMHQDISYALTTVRAQYEQFYKLVSR